MPTAPTHYEVLQLSDGNNLNPDDVKQAYHRALLLHHPDKVQKSQASSTEPTPLLPGIETPTIDQIVAAYACLSDPSQRKSYDAALKTSSGPNNGHRGVDTFDLDDMRYSEAEGQGSWQRGCRCDSKDGYIVSEEELEKADKEQTAQADGVKDLLVQCRGCSLFIRVTFAAAGE